MNAERVLANIMRWWIVWIIWIIWATVWYNIVDQSRTYVDYDTIQVEQINENWTVETSVKTINEALRMMWYKTQLEYDNIWHFHWWRWYTTRNMSYSIQDMKKLELEKIMKENSWWSITYKFAEKQVWLKNAVWLSIALSIMMMWLIWPFFLIWEDWRYNNVARNIIRKINSIPEQIWITFYELFKKLWFQSEEIKELKKKTTTRRKLNSIELAQEVQKEMKKYNIK